MAVDDYKEYIGIAPKIKELLDSLEEVKKFDYINFNQTPAHSSADIGNVYYDSDNGTLSVKLSNNVTMQVGQEQLIRAVNKTDATITNGKVVYVSGATGNRPKIDLVDTTNLGISCVLGLATEDILKNEYGYVCTFGLVRGLNTQGISEGTRLYASSNGNWSTSIPVDGYRRFWIGSVIKEHVDDGWILVNVREIPYMFGDLVNGNYSLFESDGTLKFVGTATTFDDLPPKMIATSRIPAVNNPTLTTFLGNIQQYTFAVNDYVANNFEILHKYKEGSTVEFHLHWANNGLEAVAKYFKVQVEYTIANAMTAFPATGVLESEVTIPANTADRTHEVSTIGTLNIPTLKIGSVILFNIKRITSTGTAPVANPFFLQVGCHIEMDTLGSRTMYIK
jgi:hypothetical protein